MAVMATDKTYVVLLRGINVGGHAKVAMAALRATCESVGCTEVATYIQSGNVVLRSTRSAADLRSTLEAAIADQLDVAPVVVVRTAAQIESVLTDTPYPDADEGTVHVAFLAKRPSKAEAAVLSEIQSPPEELTVVGDAVYLHLPNGLGRAKIPVQLGRSSVTIPVTVRNWRTVTKLHEMASALG